MRSTHLTALPLLTAALCVGLASASPAQGGWRQWDVHLHDGRRLEANPLGAPDDAHLSLSVGAYEGRERRLARALVHFVAARPTPGDSLPNAAVVASCADAIVRRDGTRTVGHITLARVEWSEGVVMQRGDTVDLRDVAYLVFAAPRSARADCRRHAKPKESDVASSSRASTAAERGRRDYHSTAPRPPNQDSSSSRSISRTAWIQQDATRDVLSRFGRYRRRANHFTHPTTAWSSSRARDRSQRSRSPRFSSSIDLSSTPSRRLNKSSWVSETLTSG